MSIGSMIVISGRLSIVFIICYRTYLDVFFLVFQVICFNISGCLGANVVILRFKIRVSGWATGRHFTVTLKLTVWLFFRFSIWWVCIEMWAISRWTIEHYRTHWGRVHWWDFKTKFDIRVFFYEFTSHFIVLVKFGRVRVVNN